MTTLMPISTLPDHLDLDDWGTIESQLDALLAEQPTAGTAQPWLEAWSALAIRIGESASLTSIEHSRDTTEPERKSAYLHMVREVYPRLKPLEQRLKQSLLESGFSEASMETTLRRFRAEVSLFREANVPLQAEEQVKASGYSDITGSLTASFAGEERTMSQLQPFLASPDRQTRQDAWEAGQDAYASVAEPLDALYESLLPIREKLAENAGFESYRELKWQQLGRFDYSPDDALRFFASIRATFVPALERRASRRAELLGLDALRPWDISVDPHGSAALQPFQTGDELAEGSARIFDRVGPVLGQRIRSMQEGGLLDLENRKGKAPGGYCASLQARKMPFIFMNSVGTDRNLKTMLHEAGHAFHVFEAGQLPLIWQRHAPMEFCEVASMAMELLASPFIDRDSGGFYDEVEAIRSRVQHLEGMLFFMPYMATVAAFQHAVYTQPGQSRADRNATWLALQEDFCVGVDWSGYETARQRLWHQKLHIFRAPFYYIEYGIAQLGALQVWRASKANPEMALERYLDALALGGTRSLPELFRAAGAELTWDAEPMGELVALIEEEIASLEASLPAG